MLISMFVTVLLAAGPTSPGPATEAGIALCSKSAEFISISTTTGPMASSQHPTIVGMRTTSRAVLDRYASRRTGPNAARFDQLGRTEFHKRFNSQSPVSEVWAVVQTCAAPAGRPG